MARWPGGAAWASPGATTSERTCIPQAIAVMQQIKAALDPHGILNPGKMFGD